ncbi:MAG: cupin domain-containing protein [Burkholderiales bacterium]|nr:cupin domain-containing protein [Burkholderiales bacterium]
MTSGAKQPISVVAAEAPLRPKPTSPPFPADMVRKVAAGRDKRPLGDLFGLSNFGVNMTTLAPGGYSALRHAHTRQDEFVYVLEGEPTLITDAGETPLKPGMCAGFKAGTGDAHHLHNRTQTSVVFLEIGDRSAGDAASYPDDNVVGAYGPDGKWIYTRKDGTPY